MSMHVPLPQVLSGDDASGWWHAARTGTVYSVGALTHRMIIRVHVCYTCSCGRHDGRMTPFVPPRCPACWLELIPPPGFVQAYVLPCH